jgi:hypothetical protein
MPDENRDCFVYFVGCPDVLYGADSAHHYILIERNLERGQTVESEAPKKGEFQCRACGPERVVTVTQPWKIGYVSRKERDELTAYSRPDESPTDPQEVVA